MDTQKPQQPKRLGRGLESLISSTATKPLGLPSSQPQPTTGHGLRQIPIRQIAPNPNQPRKHFDPARLQALADSITRTGVLQPIIVRQKGPGFELVAGERRWRACVEAGVESIPAIVREADEATLLELALVENVQREDLNPVDRASAYREMANKFGLSHEEIGARVGEDRATITNYMRMLDLPKNVLEIIAAGQLSIGHAKCLLGLADTDARSRLAASAVREGWSVRMMEDRVRQVIQTKTEHVPKAPARPVISDLESRISMSLGLRVHIKEGRRKHAGRVVVEYHTLDDFDRIMEKLGAADAT